MTTSIRPPIDIAGIWTLKAPFDIQIQTGVSYRSISVRKISDVIAKGEADPWSVYYQPYGISQADYLADLDLDVCIVTLQTNNGTTVYVPTTYITAFPDASGVQYISTILGVDLGPIPTTMTLENVKSMVVELIRDVIGIDTTVQTAVVGETQQVSSDQYASFEANRAAKIRDSTTFRARAIAAESDLAKANAKITQLTDYIKAHP